jgi:hypothetical protein
MFLQEVADAICERIAEGEPLRAICREEGMPTDRTVRNWVVEYPEFASAIARARLAGFDVIAETCLEIADDSRNDYMEKAGKDGEAGGVAFNAEHVQRSKLRIETRLKLLAKWDPKRYGEKIEQTLQGTDGGAIRIVATSHDEAL